MAKADIFSLLEECKAQYSDNGINACKLASNSYCYGGGFYGISVNFSGLVYSGGSSSVNCRIFLDYASYCTI